VLRAARAAPAAVVAHLERSAEKMSFFAIMALFYVLALGPIICARLLRVGTVITLIATAASIGMLIAIGAVYRLSFASAELNATIPVWISSLLILVSVFVGVRLVRSDH
jgi:hypothetical protein